jgi:hypothetical protein
MTRPVFPLETAATVCSDCWKIKASGAGCRQTNPSQATGSPETQNDHDSPFAKSLIMRASVSRSSQSVLVPELYSAASDCVFE